MYHARLLLILLVLPTFASAEEPLYVVEAPSVVLDGVPVTSVVVRRRIAGSSDVDRIFAGEVPIEGVVLETDGEPIPIPAFEGGTLSLGSNPQTRTTLQITGDIVVAPGSDDEVHYEVTSIPGWLSLVPPIIAVVLAIWLRQVLPALFLGILSGAFVLALGHPIVAFELAVQEFVVEPMLDQSHVQVILFTTFLGSTVAVMYASGGTHALVGLLRPWLRTRNGTQVGTAALGTLVFFDDYANSLLVGTTMRPVTDGRRISREKLAFLVDATAAPIAGLALISTWVGFEVAQIETGYGATGMTADPYLVFLATLPYRFYPILLLVFVFANAWTGRDFGPMLRAERRALETGDVGAVSGDTADDLLDPDRPLVVNAAVPLAFLIIAIGIGLWWTGSAGAVKEGEPVTLRNVLANADSYAVLLYSSFLASVVAIGCALATGVLTLEKSVAAWTEGVKHMLPAMMVLVLAWGIAAVCNDTHLNTAAYLVTATSGWVTADWLPTLAFLLAAGVAFATGSSWATMGLVIPLFVPYAFDLLVTSAADGAVDPYDPRLLGTVGAVLAGSIFGDHCSPISDTTVLSSAASGCDHLAHVGTQLPYALVVGGVSVVCCSMPLAFGVSPWAGLGVGCVTVIGIVWFAGQPVRDDRAERDDSADRAGDRSPAT